MPTYSENLLPNATGLDVGSSAQRWDGFFQNIDISGTFSFPTGALTAIGGMYFVSQYTGADKGAQINAASTAAGSNAVIYVDDTSGVISTPLSLAAGTVLLFCPGRHTIAPGHTISNIATKIRGTGRASTFLEINSATGDLFTIAANYFELSGMHVRPATGITRTSGHILSVNAGAGPGLVQDVTVTDPFRFMLNQGTQWNLTRAWGNSSGGNWDYFLRTYKASGTASETHMTDCLVSRATSTQSAPILVLDSRTDTVEAKGCTLLSTGTGDYPCIQGIDSDGVGGYPRFLHFVNCLLEGSLTSATTTVTIDLQACRDFSFADGYITRGQNGVSIGTSAKNVRLVNNHYAHTTQDVILIAASSASYTVISNSVFEGVDSSLSVANTYDILKVGANATNFSFTNNLARIGPSLLSYKYGVEILAGTSNKYIIGSNHATDACGTGFLLDGGTGTDKNIYANAFTNNSFSRATTVPTLTATAVAPTVAAGQIGYGSTTAATATNGTGEAMKANVEGYIIVNIAGTAYKIPYVKS